MPNLLADASKWTDESSGSPPSYWSGTAYDFLTGYGSAPSITATAAAGDTVAVATSINAISTHSTAMAITVNGDAVYTNDLQTVGVADFTSASLNAGDVVVIRFNAGGTGLVYDLDVSLTPLVVECNYNCDCDDDYPTETLADFRKHLMVRLGFAAMLASPPPGMVDLLNSFVIEAQELLYRKYSVFRLERWFTWDMTAGTRFYDFAANADACTKKMDPRKVTWVGISQGCDSWRPLHCGIEPTRYSSNSASIPDSYEVRQCIEVWPAPADDTWKLRIKGDFGLLAFAEDTDVNTIDPQPIKLLALANAKAHYGQPDAGNYMAQLTTLIGDLTAGSHHTRRYIPGTRLLIPAVRPKVVD